MFEGHMLEGEHWERWMHHVRRFEFERMMEKIPLGRATTVLELGSGDGFQLDLLRERFERICAIDPVRRPACTCGFVFAMAEALPFPDGTFDLVFSSNIMEHLTDRPHGVEEAVRVLRPGGYMAHVFPGRYWKATSVLLNPLAYPLHVLGKWSKSRKSSAEQLEFGRTDLVAVRRPGILRVLGKCIYPEIHGTYSSHWIEFKDYGRHCWAKLFTHPKLVRVADVPLLSYSAFGFLRFRLHPLRVWMARNGLSSCYGFILRKVE